MAHGPPPISVTRAQVWPLSGAISSRAQQSVYRQWVAWSHGKRFTSPHAVEDFANPAQLNRLDWYSANRLEARVPG